LRAIVSVSDPPVRQASSTRQILAFPSQFSNVLPLKRDLAPGPVDGGASAANRSCGNNASRMNTANCQHQEFTIKERPVRDDPRQRKRVWSELPIARASSGFT